MKLMKLLLLVSLMALLGGCATNAAVNKMVYAYSGNQMPQNKSLINGIAVNQVTGGHQTNPMWKSKIDNPGFKSALVQSLQDSKLSHQPSGARYVLDAKLLKLHQPTIALNVTVSCEVNYILRDTTLNKIVYNKTITSSYTEDLDQSLIGVYRLEAATEGAARANIKQLIDNLYQLKA